MSMTNEAIKEYCCKHLTPGYFLGVMDKSKPPCPSFWRDFIFNQPDITTNRKYMFWQEIRDKYGDIFPTEICPCEEGEYVAESQEWVEKFISFAYWWQGMTVDCDWEQMLGPGETRDNAKSFEAALRDHFISLQNKVISGFDAKEEYWSAMLAIQQKVTIRPKGGKPYEVKFERDPCLNHTLKGNACWKSAKESKEACHTPLCDLQYMQDLMWKKCKGQIDVWVMNKNTCDAFRNGSDIKECLKTFNPNLFVPNLLQTANLEPRPQFDGARREFIIGNGMTQEIWCVNSCMSFCDPTTGENVDVDLLPDGKVLGFNRSATARNRYNARWAYGRVHNFNNTGNRPIKRFAHQHVTPDGKAIKYHMESAPIPLIECPDASVCLDVGCGGK